MSFTRADYQAVFNFALEQYYFHESTGRTWNLKAAIVMEKCEETIGQISEFPEEARKRLRETPRKIRDKIWNKLAQLP